mgnify:CR=1 FL=1|jgi:transcriptional regulator with XRE-family HTH domain
MEFKEKLKDLRKQNNMTQDALAQEIHVSRSTIAKWEAGLGLPQQDSMEKLCNIFEISEEELISSNYKEETLISKNRKIHSLNKRVLGISITFGLVFILTIVIACLIISKIKYVNSEADLYTTIHLTNYTDINSNYVAFAGEIRTGTLLKYEYGYSRQKISFEKIKFTDKSSLVLICVIDQFTPGHEAYLIGEDNFKKDSTLEESYIEIEFNDDVNTIYSWPNFKLEWVRVNSVYSENVVYDFSMFFSRIHIQKVSNQLQFYYQESFEDIILSNDKKEIIREFDYLNNENSSLWKYQMYNYAKNITFHTNTFYLIEVNDVDSNSFEFSIVTGMSNGKHEIKRKQYITCFL